MDTKAFTKEDVLAMMPPLSEFEFIQRLSFDTWVRVRIRRSDGVLDEECRDWDDRGIGNISLIGTRFPIQSFDGRTMVITGDRGYVAELRLMRDKGN